MINVADGFVSLMGENGDLKEDLRLPEGDLGEEIDKRFESGELLVSFCGQKNTTQFHDLQINST